VPLAPAVAHGVTDARRWLSAFWPLLLLAVFIGTFRRAAPDLDAGASTAGCDESSAQPGADDVPRLERCLGLDPSNAALLSDLGRLYQSSGRIEDAERAYRRAVAVDPSNSDLHVRLGELLLARGDRPGARREGETALRWRPNSLAASRLVTQASALTGRPPS